MNAPIPLSARLTYTVDEKTGCWVWSKCLNDSGYGIIGTNGRGTFRAHIVSFESHHGREVAQGMLLDHTCRNRACINPKHLEEVTNAENTRRGAKAKLGWPEVRQIRVRFAAGATRDELAAAYDTSSKYISHIVNNRRWIEGT